MLQLAVFHSNINNIRINALQACRNDFWSKLLKILKQNRNKQDLKGMLFNRTRQCKIQICFCNFDLFCPLLDKGISIEYFYFALSCPIK